MLQGDQVLQILIPNVLMHVHVDTYLVKFFLVYNMITIYFFVYAAQISHYVENVSEVGKKISTKHLKNESFFPKFLSFMLMANHGYINIYFGFNLHPCILTSAKYVQSDYKVKNFKNNFSLGTML